MIYDIILKNAELIPEKISLKSNNMEISYGMLWRNVKNFASEILDRGFVKGDKVLILLPNTIEFIISFFGANLAGGTAVLADIKYNDEILAILKENDIKFIITDILRLEKIRRVIEKHETNTYSGYKDSIRIITIDEKSIFYMEHNNKDIPDISYDRNELDGPSMILYTSGSTGKPKGVVNSHRNLEEALKNYTQTVSMYPADKIIAVTPFFHSYSFGSCMLAGLMNGATLLIEEIFKPRKILKIISQEKATIFHGVPFMYKLINEQLTCCKYDLSSLRLCVSAGSRLIDEIAMEFNRLTGKIIHQEYGSSETGTIAINLSDNLYKNIKSVGKPLKNVAIQLIKKDNMAAELLQVKSKGLSLGYLDEKPFKRDWYPTGDICELDENGFIYIVGRANRLINTAGLKVNPAEVEEHLLKHPGIVDAIVRGCKNEDFGEVVEALVVRKETNISFQDIINFCQKSLAEYKIPKIIKWVDSINKSGTGKSINM